MKKLRPNVRGPQAGFSLAEMMVVIVIIGLLATMVVPNVMRNLASAYKTTAKADIAAINGALQTYIIDHGLKYPDTLDVLIEKDGNGEAYLKRESIPKDPWKMEYMYEPPSGSEPHRVYTLGKDGIPGGEGDNADMDQISILQDDE